MSLIRRLWTVLLAGLVFDVVFPHFYITDLHGKNYFESAFHILVEALLFRFLSRMDLSRAHTSAKTEQSALALTHTVDTSHSNTSDCFLHAVFPEKL